jgi:hypothetical protein
VVAPGVRQVTTVVPPKVLRSEHRDCEFPTSVEAFDAIEAVRIARDQLVDKARANRWGKWVDLPDGSTEWYRWDFRQHEPYAKVEWNNQVLPIGVRIVPTWWYDLAPRARLMSIIEGGGVSINLNPSTGVQVTPIPTPPLPEPPGLTHERKHELFRKVSHPIFWKYPTVPTRFEHFGDALEMAWSIEYITGGAEIWELPTHMGYVVTSEGYYHYIGG